MKSILLVLSLICVTIKVNAQYYNDVLTYSINGTPVNGVKIKTNLPLINSSQMPTIMIEGYAFSSSDPINLTLVYYYYLNTFNYSRISTAGSHNPNIFLAGENGKVVIFIDSKVNFQRFHIRAYANGLGQDLAANYSGWTAVDSTLSASAVSTFQVPYENSFAGNVYMPKNGTWDSTGRVGIGTLAPVSSLSVYSATANEAGATFQAGSESRFWVTAGNNVLHIGLKKDTGVINVANSSKVGIGTIAPGDKLTVQDADGTVTAGQHSIASFIRLTGADTRGVILGYYADGTNVNAAVVRSSNGTDMLLQPLLGNVGIGTTTTGSYKLAVEGTIGARRLKITQQATWADFVFQSDYQLPPLQEVENYIKTNKHLAGIPSESEVKKEGIDVGEMNKLLLQKVEELTLYMIEEHKQKQKMQEVIEELLKTTKELKEKSRAE
jgi:hypothetical protein